uniref:High affinity immunoglobulin epsilon receptor subunit gamma n=1 Tax=Astyanax mexicanus TaxID=7994 RepID=A0A3B1J4U0_ASTMX
PYGNRFILSSVFTTEAMSLSDPVTCYILDAVLLLYCIIFTALYFRIKVRLGLNKNAMTDEYETLAGQSGQAGGPVRRVR